jgi:hypothetical protein
MHHIFPELIPPMDNAYTLKFFFGYVRPNPGYAEFSAIFRAFWEIAQASTPSIHAHIGAHPFNTSVTKVIDNVIVGAQLAP